MGPAIVLFAQTAIFWIRHRNVDEDAYMTYDDDEQGIIEPTKTLEKVEPEAFVSDKKE